MLQMNTNKKNSLAATEPCESIFIAGWDGFIGRHLTAALKNRFPKAQISGCGARDIDLIQENSWKSLSNSLDSNTRLLVLAGVKRQAGDALASFEANMKIAVTVARAVEHSRPARLVLFSSSKSFTPDFRFTTLEEGLRQTLDQEAANA
jgi:nucleoside-diphosphate-sugar epimerase